MRRPEVTHYVMNLLEFPELWCLQPHLRFKGRKKIIALENAKNSEVPPIKFILHFLRGNTVHSIRSQKTVVQNFVQHMLLHRSLCFLAANGWNFRHQLGSLPEALYICKKSPDVIADQERLILEPHSTKSNHERPTWKGAICQIKTFDCADWHESHTWNNPHLAEGAVHGFPVKLPRITPSSVFNCHNACDWPY